MLQKYYKNNKIKFSLKFITLFSYILFFKMLNSVLAECPRDAPILIYGVCRLEYCSKNEFDSNYCNINNTIIKDQWLNNIIRIGGLNYRYINFASYSNGDMIVETTCYPGEPKRYFYGIKKNGRPFFKNKTNQENTPYYVIETNGQNNHKGKYESEAIVIKSSESGDGNGKEYFLSVSKLECYAELFDFENDKIYYKSMKKFTGIQIVKTFRHGFFSYASDDINKYYYFFGFTSDINANENQNLTIKFQKHIFTSISGFESKTSYSSTQTLLNGYGKIISSFQTPGLLIICFFLIKTDKIYFNIRKYASDFKTPIIDYKFESNIDDEEIFYKCIHLKGNVGIFSYYKLIYDIPYLFLMFKEYNIESEKFENYLPSKYSDSEIILNQKEFIPSVSLNDFIKIDETKLCFSSVLTNKETVYIILINIFGDRQIKIRYYSLLVYPLFKYKILYELRIHNFNKFLAFASSYCPNQECDENDDEHYSGLMIFSYPNSTDTILDLEKYIFEKNIDFNNLEIDLKTKLLFQNNIYGYILSKVGIGDINDCEQYKFFKSNHENQEINGNTTLNLDENIIIKYRGNGIYPTINCKIQYYFIATEPDKSIFDSYPETIDGDDDNDAYFKKEEYIGKLSNYFIKLNHEITSHCSINCNLCLNDEDKYCITCKYNYNLTIENGISSKICLDKEKTDIISNSQLINNEITDIMSDIISEEKTEIISDEIKITFKTEEIEKFEKNYTNEDILENQFKNVFITEDQIDEINNYIKEEYLSEEYNGKNNIIKTENVLFQITTLDNQTSPNDTEISIIDLGKCEEKLRLFYQIPKEESLIIYKTDIKTSGLIQTYVQYEIYNPFNLERLNLSICEEEKITIITKINLNNSTISLYDSLNKSGYNLFNLSDLFYNDICSTYTSLNGTDMTLVDRKSEIYETNGNISLCQIGCELTYYNPSTYDIKCDCSPQINEIETIFCYSDDKFIIKMFKDSIFTNIKNSNILVLTCYKLILDMNKLLKNIGNFFMNIIIVLFFACLFFFIFKDFKKIDTFMIIIINANMTIIKSLNQKENNKKKEKKRIIQDRIKKNILKMNNKNKIEKFAPLKKSNTSKNDKNVYLINSIDESSNIFIHEKINKKLKNYKIQKGNHYSNNNNKKIKDEQINKNSKKEETNPKNENNKEINIINKNKTKLASNFSIIFKNQKINLNTYNLNEHEINSLKYEEAIKLDKRTYCQIYLCQLKRKQLLLFTFCPAKDYNLLSIKICLFLTNFSLYLTINCFFFSDETMHKIYLDNGAYRIIYQLPQILYTLIISSSINSILRLLSLSENNIISLKKIKNPYKIKAKSKSIKKCLTIKLISYFIINFLLLLFFWYFISCFCAVFINTQTILLKDSIISFGLSLLYPFGYYLIPGIFRIHALKAKIKDKICLYETGKILSLI